MAIAWAVAGALGCEAPPVVPASPTWVDVSPILRGECGQCHGSTAPDTGFGYRLDFYDMSADVCGDAARAIPGGILAGAAAVDIRDDISPLPGKDRAAMPPAPGPPLYDWERQTLQRWANQPVKGPPPPNNRPPTIQVSGLAIAADKSLAFTALLEDPDTDPVVGVIEVADTPRFAMNRSGTFSVACDTSALPTGTTQRITAVLCDGWTHVTVELGRIDIQH